MDTISPANEVTQIAIYPGTILHHAASSTETMLKAGSGSYEAVAKANQILAKGMWAIMTGQSEVAKASMAETMRAYSSFGAIKSFKDVLEIHTGLVRYAIDHTIENNRQLATDSMKLIQEAFAPVKARMAIGSP